MKSTIVIALLTVICIAACTTLDKKSNIVKTTPNTPVPVVKQVNPPQPPNEDLLDDKIPLLQATTINQNQSDTLEQRRFSITLNKTSDLKDVLLALVKDTDIGIIIDDGVAGNVPTLDIKNTSLKEILSFLLPANNLKYKWQGKNLHIFKNPLLVRYFKMDYLSMIRKGKRQVSFSTRSNENSGMGGGASGGATGGMSSGGSGGGQGGGSNQSTNEITVEYENSIWNTFIDSMKTIVFGNLISSDQHQDSPKGGGQSIKAYSHADANGKSLIISPETGIVALRATQEDILRAGDFIERYVGEAQRQVWIEAKILEVNLYKGYQMGIDWGAIVNRDGYYGILSSKRTLTSPATKFSPGAVSNQDLSSSNGAFQIGISNNMVDIVLDALAKQGQLRILSNDRISTLNNQKALIRMVREEAFFNLQTQISQGLGGNVSSPSINVQIVPIGIVMDILPQINDKDEIILSVNPDISELYEVKQFEVTGASASQPVIDRRSIDTLAKLKNGQTLVIAGIIKEKKNEVIRGVPFLSKIPILGNLFRRTEQMIEKTELVIFITPTIIAGQAMESLTQDELKKLDSLSYPMHLGDAASLEEGLKGEIKDFKKEKKD